MKLTDVLPKIPQYEAIPYAKNFNCTECEKTGFWEVEHKPNVVGWCETNIGYMIVFECPYCYQKFRFHGTIGTWNANIEEFEYYLHFYASQCANWKDIQNNIKNES